MDIKIKPQERIECAALVITLDGVTGRHLVTLPRPNRHPDIMDFIAANVDNFHIVAEGFMTDTNRFVDRKEAATIAAAAHQIISKDFNPTCLYTEDIW